MLCINQYDIVIVIRPVKERGGDHMDRYDHNTPSVFLLYYHLVLVVKYRRRVFDEEISNRAREIFCYIAPHYGLTWRNGITIQTTYISFSGGSPKVKSADLSMLTRVHQAVF